MATSTNLPDRAPEETDNPAQEEYEQLVKAKYDSGTHKGQEGAGGKDKAAGDSSDPRGTGLDDIREQESTPSGPSYNDPYSDASFYKKSGDKKGLNAKLNNSAAAKRYIIFGGIGAAIVALIIALFSFLNVFKLDGLMSNIEQRAFIRNNASLDGRSSKYISAYIEARMFQWGDSTDINKNTFFRSNKVDTNSPFTDWYRTLRTSNFEQEVFEKHGIKFVSVVDANGNIRPGKIDIETPGTKDIADLELTAADLTDINNGDVLKVLNRHQEFFDLDKFDTSKEARAEIKKVVKANTHWYEIYQRRFLRRSIQNMTGVRDWRFFDLVISEETQNKIVDAKTKVRNKFLDKMLPNNGLMSQVVRCLYGITQCRPNADVASTADRISTADLAETDNPSDNSAIDQRNEEALSGSAASELDAAGISDALKKVLLAANVFTKILNIPQTLDMLSYLNKNIGNLVKLVVVARGAQASGLYQVFETARDQQKSGDVTGEEVNALMENINTAGSSAGFSQVISGDSGSPPGTTQTGGQCTQAAQALQEKDPQAYQKRYGDYAPLCADQQIGSAANAQKLQEAYNNTIGHVVGPIAGTWGKLKSTPILGNLIGLVEWFGDLVGNVSNFVVTNTLQALGLQDNVNAAIAWVFAKTSNFLGITILKGYESGGTIFNWLVQGGAYTAESDKRMAGAALTTPATKATAQTLIGQYQSDLRDQTSLYDKVASLDNPDSLAFKGATALSNVQANPSTAVFNGLHGLLSDFGKSFGTIFGGQLLAATPNGYAASDFAGINTYDYPQQCYDLDPMTAEPLTGTNAVQVLSNPRAYGVDHAPFTISTANMEALKSWDTERNSEKFYTTVYNIIGKDTFNADDTAVHIYNCNLLDTVVRGSIGYLYGYDADEDSQVIGDGITSTSTSSSSSSSPPPASSGVPFTGDIYGSSVDVDCDARTTNLGVQTGYRNGSPVQIRICGLPNLPSSSEESSSGSSFYIAGSNGKAIVNSVYSTKFYDLVEAAKADGVVMYANSGFRSMAHQQCLYNGNCGGSGPAQPGYSNHQMGLAIDFGTSSHITISAGDQWYNWLSGNATKFNVSNESGEDWHWSADGH